ncbi:MAG TPA: hypothetical protein PLU30_05085 [Verrucomicrobiae bacterium]|nr:hypothetical protein [Verrucomicrobiae bacterium]
MKIKISRFASMSALSILLAAAGPQPCPAGHPQEDVEKAIREVQAAESDARNNIPWRTLKDAEDKLDAIGRKIDDLQAELEYEQAKDHPSEKSINALKVDIEAAAKAKENAMAHADFIRKGGRAISQEKATAYREALDNRRTARMKLKKALARLRPLLHGLERQVIENTNREGHRILRGCDEPIAAAEIASAARSHIRDLVGELQRDTVRTAPPKPGWPGHPCSSKCD